MRKLLWLTATALAVAACNNTSFKSAPPRKAAEDVQVKPNPPAQKTFKLACQGDEGVAHLAQDLDGDARTMVRLEGEFCGIEQPIASGSLTVLFVVDYSGSMLQNDPEIDGSCGRLKAAEALVGKLDGMVTPKVKIEVGLLPFGDLALPGTKVTSISAFKAALTASSFCSTDGGATNYEAAFVEAKNQLTSVEGQKSIYLISDGLPTRKGTTSVDPTGFPSTGNVDDALKEVEAAGAGAAQALRAAEPDLALNAIFLGASDLGASNPGLGGTPTDPQTYLERITGSKDRVRVVTDADKLAEQIVSLDTPEVTTVDVGSVKGVIAAASFGERELKLSSLDKDLSREGVWKFTTDPFELYGKDGQKIANEVILVIKTSDGVEHKATAKLSFTQKAASTTIGTSTTP